MISIARSFPKQLKCLTKACQLTALNKNILLSQLTCKKAIATDAGHRSAINLLIKKSIEYERSTIGLNFYQTKLRADLENSKPIILDDLYELLYLSKTDSDLDLLMNATVTYANQNNIRYFDSKNDLGRKIIQLFYLLRKTDLLLSYYKDMRYAIFFKSHRGLETFYNLLNEEERYDDTILLFKEKISSYLKKEISKDSEEKKTVISIPISHMQAVTKAFLLQNKDDSLKSFRDVLNFIQSKNGDINPFFVLRIVYLAILKNDGNFAMDLFRSKIFENDKLLSINLRVIINAKCKQTDNAMKGLKSMFYNNIPIFPFTFKCLKQVDPKDVNYPQIDHFYKKAILESRFAKVDLTQIVFQESAQNAENLLKEQEDLVQKFENKSNSRNQNKQQREFNNEDEQVSLTA